MTPEQATQARAALGLVPGRTRTLWNFRSLMPTNPVWPVWQAMVAAGLATVERTGSAWCPDLHAFRLTQATARAVLLPGEVLDDKTVWGIANANG